MKKITTYLILCLFSLSILTACGGSDKDAAGDQGVTESADAKASEKSADESIHAKNEDNTQGKSSEKVDSNQQKVIEGTFMGLQQGDLFYFNIKDNSGKTWSLIVMKTDATYEKISANPAQYKGKKMKVTYKKTTKHIENNGGNMTFDEYLKAEVM